MLPALEPHSHAAAVLGAALESPSHAYLLHGPAGSGKREAARAVAAELLAQGAADPESARRRALAGAHPDLTWVAPSGAHEMLRRDVEESVVAAAAHTPFEAARRVFVLERVDTMNDEAANRLLKTLEEPPPYVVLLLLTERPTQVLPTVASRCLPVRFDPPPPDRLAAALEAEGVAAPAAAAAGRLSLGDGERAHALVRGDGPALRAAAEALARAPLHGRVASQRPWKAVLELARARARAAEEELERALAEELAYLPRKEHKRRQTEYAERARRAGRRAETGVIDHALQLAGLWHRDLAARATGAPELVAHVDREAELAAEPERPAAVFLEALELVEETRTRLLLNVSAELALEALAYRLEALFAPVAAAR